MSKFPPVNYDNARVPFGSPQWMPPLAQNAPAQKGRSSAPGAGGIAETRSDHAYARVIDFNSAVGVTSALVLAQPTGLRNLLALRNASSGTQIIYIGFGANASSNSTIAIAAGQIVLFDTVVPQDDIYAISSAAGGSLSIAYSVIPEV